VECFVERTKKIAKKSEKAGWCTDVALTVFSRAWTFECSRKKFVNKTITLESMKEKIFFSFLFWISRKVIIGRTFEVKGVSVKYTRDSNLKEKSFSLGTKWDQKNFSSFWGLNKKEETY
jgi:hypothetical protein